MADEKTGLVELVVVSDGLAYRLPGQKEPEPPKVYATAAANRGDTIFVEKKEADRFVALGAVAKPGEKAALFAVAVQHRWGPPVGAQPISSDGNLPTQKIEKEARELGLTFQKGTDDDDGGGISGEPPADIDLTNEAAVSALNVPQLRNIAAARNLELPSKATKPDLVQAIVASAQPAS